jgi:hypothetical protein
MPKKRRAKRARDDRPSVEELGGISEYQVRAASDVEEGDPMQSVVQAATSRPKGGAPNDELSIAPDELGPHYLKGAVQDQRPDAPEPELPAEEELVADSPDDTERELELGELANDVVREVQRGHGPRERRAVEKLSEERKLATRRASERRH